MEATPATSHLYIMGPLGGGGIMRLFSTHPSTEDRIRRLEQISRYTRLRVTSLFTRALERSADPFISET